MSSLLQINTRKREHTIKNRLDIQVEKLHYIPCHRFLADAAIKSHVVLDNQNCKDLAMRRRSATPKLHHT